MRILVDTNVILDVILQREPFYEDSKQIMIACQQELLWGTIEQVTFEAPRYCSTEGLLYCFAVSDSLPSFYAGRKIEALWRIKL